MREKRVYLGTIMLAFASDEYRFKEIVEKQSDARIASSHPKR